MYVQVRVIDTGLTVTIPTSRTTVVGVLKKLIESKLHVSPDKQRLFYAGKQVRIDHIVVFFIDLLLTGYTKYLVVAHTSIIWYCYGIGECAHSNGV